MTTEHVSVPRESLNDVHDALRERLGHDNPITKRVEFILSRATPSDVQEAVATTCKPVPCTKNYSEVTFSGDDWERLGKLPEGTKLYANPAPSAPRVVTADGWAERHDSVQRFALRIFLQQARLYASECAQDKEHRFTAAGDEARYLADAQTAQECLTMLEKK